MELRVWADLDVGALTACILFGVVTILYVGNEFMSRFFPNACAKPSTEYAPVELSEAKADDELSDPEGGEAAPPTPPPAASNRLEALDLSNASSVKTLLKFGTQFGMIMLYTWICEYQPMYPQGQKHAERDHFWFLALVMALISILKVEKTCNTDILNRDQTEEWKGWMQYIFLAYHYFHFSDVYNSIRVFISCYVWMTGFGNFSFFYMKHDFSWIRWWNMMWRLNFLVFFLCLVHGNTYILYYICPLHTFYFCMVYVSMRVGSHLNHTKWGIRLKILALAALIFVIWEIPSVFELVFFFLPAGSTIGAKGGTQKEFHFRTALDHWSALFGMIFALNFPFYTRWTKKIEELTTGAQVLIKGSVALVLFVGAYHYSANLFFLPKLEYNEVHPYIFLLPMLFYIFVRNISVGARSYYSHYLAEMGKITLETYLMQHHIWLTSNAKTLLVLIPDWPECNMFVCTMLYVLVSHRLYRLTLNLRAMLIPTEKKDSLRYLGWMIAALSNCALLGLILKETVEINAYVMVAVCSIVAAAVAVLFKVRQSAEKLVMMLSVVALILVVISMFLMGEPAKTQPPTPAPIPGKADGIAQDFTYGVAILLAAGSMLFTFDNFYGLSVLSSKAWPLLGLAAPVSVTYSDSYDKLNERLREQRQR